MAAIVIAVTDLLFQTRIAAAVEALGHRATITDNAEATAAAITGGADGVIVDLHADGIDPDVVIRAARAAGAGVLAFGRHTDAATLRAARAAGANTVVPRSQLVEELPALIEALVAATVTRPPK